jgi:hypothetical protein
VIAVFVDEYRYGTGEGGRDAGLAIPTAVGDAGLDQCRPGRFRAPLGRTAHGDGVSRAPVARGTPS